MDTPLTTEEGLAPLPRHLHGFALTHIAMRRDSRRLVAAVPLLTTVGFPAAADWWRQLCGIIDWHHRTEDDILWPGLIERLPSFAAYSNWMAQDHVALDHAMAAVTTALDSADQVALAHATIRFDEVLHDHLRDEEQVCLRAFAQVPADVFLAIERKVLIAAPLRVKVMLPPWLLDTAPGTADPAAVGVLPAPVRFLGRTVLRRRYARTLRGITRPC